MKKVMAMGTFDMLHPGHVEYLKQAKKEGDYLIVVVARDETVENERGRKPVAEEKDRLEVVKHLDLVDEAVLGNVGDKIRIVEVFKPAVICLGYDQRVNEEELESELKKRALNVTVKRMGSYKEDRYKSEILKKRGFVD